MVERKILFAIQRKNRNSNAINLHPESPKCHLIANGGLLFGVCEFGLRRVCVSEDCGPLGLMSQEEGAGVIA